MGEGEEVGELCDQGSGSEPEEAEKKFGWMSGDEAGDEGVADGAPMAVD